MKDWKFRRIYWLWLGFASLLVGGSNSVLGEEFYFESAGGRLRCVVEGKGEPVLLLHGFAEDSDKGWVQTGILKGLVKSRYRVIAVDCMGHGGSARPHTSDAYGLAIVDGIISLLDSIPVGKVHGVGYSMGAALMNKLLDRHPQRFLSVTLSGYGQPPLPDRVTDGLVEEIRSNLERMQLAAGNDPRALAHLCVGWNEWLVATESLSRNKVPTLALIGSEDIFLPDTRQLVEAMSQCRLEIVDGDHGTARGQKDYLTKLVRFLDQNRVLK